MYSLLIKFIDGEELILKSVTSYGISDDGKRYIVWKNGYNQVFNFASVKYIGRWFDLTNQEVNKK